MRGTILEFNAQSSQGVISGEDGARYGFGGTDVAGDFARIRAGATVDFQVAGTRAEGIYPLALASGNGVVIGDKNRMVAGLLALFIGTLGIHKFYLGQKTAGIIMLACTLLGAILLFIPTLVIAVVAFVEAIIYFMKSDEDFQRIYVEEGKAWF